MFSTIFLQSYYARPFLGRFRLFILQNKKVGKMCVFTYFHYFIHFSKHRCYGTLRHFLISLYILACITSLCLIALTLVKCSLKVQRHISRDVDLKLLTMAACLYFACFDVTSPTLTPNCRDVLQCL